MKRRKSEQPRVIVCGYWLLFSTTFFVGINGCSQKVERFPLAPVEVAEKGPIEPAEVELSNPKYRIDDEGNFFFEVNYRFTKGSARQFYLLTVHFPGTQNMCMKHMEAHHLKQKEGVIKDGIPLTEKEITTYEIQLSEADSPMNEYKPISNKLTAKADSKS